MSFYRQKLLSGEFLQKSVEEHQNSDTSDFAVSFTDNFTNSTCLIVKVINLLLLNDSKRVRYLGLIIQGGPLV